MAAKIYKIIRIVFITLLVIGVGVPVGLYVVLSTPWAQEKLRTVGEEELTTLLGTKVQIGYVGFSPFDHIVLKEVSVADDNGVNALYISNLSVRFELDYFLSKHKLVFDYAAIDGMSVKLYKPSKTDKLNIAGIIDRLKLKDKNKPPTRFEFAISMVEINGLSATYDVNDRPRKEQGFDVNHISVSDLSLTANLSKVTNEGAVVKIAHLAFIEQSGFTLADFNTEVTFMPDKIAVKSPTITLPKSKIQIGSFEYTPSSVADVSQLGRTIPIDVKIDNGSFITLEDLSCVVPIFKNVDHKFDIAIDAHGTLDDITLNRLSVGEADGDLTTITTSGHVSNIMQKDSLYVDELNFDVKTRGGKIKKLISEMAPQMSPAVTAMIARAGNIALEGKVTGNLDAFTADADLRTSVGAITFDGTAEILSNNSGVKIDAITDIQHLELGTLLADNRFGLADGSLGFNGTVRGEKIAGECDAIINNLVYNGVDYHDVKMVGSLGDNKSFDLNLTMDNDAGYVDMAADGILDKNDGQLTMETALRNIDFSAFGVKGRYAGYKFSGNIAADISGSVSQWINGSITLNDLSLKSLDKTQPSLNVNSVKVVADNANRPASVTMTSDFLNGKIEGELCLGSLVPDIAKMVSGIFPAIVPDKNLHINPRCVGLTNHFNYDFELSNVEPLSHFLHLPIEVIYPVTIEGEVDMADNRLTMSVDAPYLLKGDKLIENTALQADVNNDGSADVYVTTQMPTKKGTMVLVTGLTAAKNRIDTQVNWMLEREKPINGILAFSTLLGKDENGDLTADIDFNPSDINFGKDTWHISPSHILYRNRDISVGRFEMAAGTQRIVIDGDASSRSDSRMLVDLANIELGTIFETLDINKALIGGYATGVFDARGLFSAEPSIVCDGLHVDSISYNYCVLGTGEVTAHWDNERRAVSLDADVIEPSGKHSHIYGDIFPFTEGLDISFDADNVRVGFMKPFMSAFAQDITGYASGHARLFGTFKYIDMEGDIFARDLGVKIAFTNTWYYCTDSVKLTPGLIDIKNVTVHDAYGNTAQLNGYVKHKFFKEPEFDFKVTNAVNLLSYDVTPKLSPDWYGRVFGNGSAFITGYPGVVNIDVNMSTADGSTFTFVLSDDEQADDYTFIQFRDRNAGKVTDSIIQVDHVPAAIRDIQRRMAQRNVDNPSDYNMNIQVDITPQAKLIIVMDPVGGDEIKATGAGNLRMTYKSAGNDLRMYGTYAIERGSYNFTLQDIIVKDFKIKEGSSIAFTGDPYSARLDINAIYAVNANLSDLDESFLQDKDLNRTNVPVHALLKVNGDMRQPDISFDLEFPTLTSDVYRKVRSIVSTDEMMNRQIIYLLALGRFYTPEYMSTTKGNELFSVASSTISSQLSSMLGKLSENWTIAPNVRSDKGDFSDVEFDVALSSSLLNNRLRINGNFGYRDKSLNTNQFIGDFDIEYLLNRSGSWRLKAYNRYNDQNYYLRTAQTTQGVGIMYRRDFDRMFGFLRPRKKTSENTQSLNDSTKVDRPQQEKNTPADTTNTVATTAAAAPITE